MCRATVSVSRVRISADLLGGAISHKHGLLKNKCTLCLVSFACGHFFVLSVTVSRCEAAKEALTDVKQM